MPALADLPTGELRGYDPGMMRIALLTALAALAGCAKPAAKAAPTSGAEPTPTSPPTPAPAPAVAPLPGAAYFPAVIGASYRYISHVPNGRVIDRPRNVKSAGLTAIPEAVQFEEVDAEAHEVTSGFNMPGAELFWVTDDGLYTASDRSPVDLPRSAGQRMVPFPPVVGGKGEYKHEYFGQTFTVEGFEEVKVPAGTFAGCLVLRIDTITNEVGHAWFAPGVGLVKWARHTGRIDELVSYSIPGR